MVVELVTQFITSLDVSMEQSEAFTHVNIGGHRINNPETSLFERAVSFKGFFKLQDAIILWTFEESERPQAHVFLRRIP